MSIAEADVAAGAAVYDQRTLGFYDLVVHGVSNRIAWRCPTERLRALYERNASALHLDVGVGSGYFLDPCRFPVPNPRITLVDLSSNALTYTSQRIACYQPEAVQANALEPIELKGGPFRSIATMYLLHCLPGNLKTKARVFSVLGRHLASDGVLFGATILGAGVPRSLPARALMRAYNGRGIFCNSEDSLEDLEAALSKSFREHQLELHGCVALWSARGHSA